jgi:polynucleotide 5'-hydroxyl-kinase GRC3/NOL9
VNPRLEDFVRDPSAIEELTRPCNRLIMVVGGSDTGKTTLVECAADFLSRHAPLGIVDLDMGQSHIGPPTTVAWGKIEEGFGGWSKIATEDFYFTGTTTPFGSLLPAVVGAALITDRALSCCEKVLVDTTGLVAGPAGRILKQSKVDILRPDAVLALERSEELSHILDAFRFHTHPRVFRLSVPDVVKSKAVPRRSLYRFEKMEKYLSGSHLLEVSLDAVGVRSIRELSRSNLSGLKNRVIAFRDERNRDVALGIIERTGPGENELLIRTPLSAGTRFSTIIIGKARFDREHSVLTERERSSGW